MPRLAALILAAVVACSSPPPSVVRPSPTREPGVLTVAALLDLSGPRSTLGSSQRNALEMWLARQSAVADARVPVKVRVVDVGGSDARLFIELHRAAVEDPVDAAVIGVPVTDGDLLGRAVAVASFPVLFTLPLPDDPIGHPGGDWQFALAPSQRQLAAAAVADAAARDVLGRSVVVVAADRADPYASALDALAGSSILERVALGVDGSVPSPLVTSVATLGSVHCAVQATLCVPLARAASARVAPTLFYLSYLTVPSEVSDHRELTSRSIWPASRTLTGPTAPRGVEFRSTYTSRFGVPGTAAATAYDALSLLSAVADRWGADPERLRTGLDGITLPLIASSYRFDRDRHGGFDPDDLAFVRWTGSALGLVPAPIPEPRLPAPSPARSP